MAAWQGQPGSSFLVEGWGAAKTQVPEEKQLPGCEATGAQNSLKIPVANCRGEGSCPRATGWIKHRGTDPFTWLPMGNHGFTSMATIPRKTRVWPGFINRDSVRKSRVTENKKSALSCAKIFIHLVHFAPAWKSAGLGRLGGVLIVTDTGGELLGELWLCGGEISRAPARGWEGPRHTGRGGTSPST